MEIVPRRLKPYFDGLSFDGQLQRTVGKADSGMANIREGPAIGRAAEYFRQAFLFGRDDLDACELRSSCRAGWARCCRARQCERVEQAEAD
jgi:hypothetical protein